MNRELTIEEKQRLGLATNSAPVTEGNDAREKIKILMKAKGFTLYAFELACELPAGSVNQALIRRFPKVDKMISAFLEIPIHELWPERYYASGKSIKKNRYHQMDKGNVDKVNDAILNNDRDALQRKADAGAFNQAQLPPGIFK